MLKTLNFLNYFSGEYWDSGKFQQAVFRIFREFSTGGDAFLKLKNFAISWFSLNFSLFLWPGEGTALRLPPNLAHFVCQIGSSPLRPRRSFPQGKSLFDAFSRQIFLPSGFIMDQKNWTAKSFSFSEQPQNSVRTSLVPLSICLCKFFSWGVLT